MNKYKTPKNANFLRSQKTNKEVWAQLRSSNKSKDNSLAIIQRNLSKAAIALTRGLEEEDKRDKKHFLKDSLTILSQTHLQLAAIRRENQKQVLPTVFKTAIEKSEIVEDELLYSEKFGKLLKEAKEESQNYDTKKGPFLGKRSFHPQHFQARKPFQNQKFVQNSRTQPNFRSEKPTLPNGNFFKNRRK